MFNCNRQKDVPDGISMEESEADISIRRQLEWKKAMKNILNDVGEKGNYNAMEIYNELQKAHKKIFEEKHPVYWASGFSTNQLNTYLLIRIFTMLVRAAKNE